MKPIAKRLLPHAITLFNIDLGAAYRTLLESVRVETHAAKLNFTIQASAGGAPTRYEGRLLIDAKTTTGSDFRMVDDGQGGDPVRAKVKKDYSPPWIWAALDEAGKAANWTLQEGDWLYMREGQLVSECPPYDGESDMQEFLDRHGIKKIGELAPIIDKDGTIHHWEIAYD